MAAHGCTGIPCSICGSKPPGLIHGKNQSWDPDKPEEVCLTQKAMAEYFKTHGRHGPVMVSCPCKKCSPAIL